MNTLGAMLTGRLTRNPATLLLEVSTDSTHPALFCVLPAVMRHWPATLVRSRPGSPQATAGRDDGRHEP